MLNHIVLMGRMTKDPELRYTQSQTAVTTFTLAVDRDYNSGGEKQTDFINCTAWRATAEFISKYFSKGSMIALNGRLVSRQYTDRDGKKVTVYEVNAESVYFTESKKSESPAQSYTAAAAPKFVELGDDDGDLPF